ncbi:DNA-processing protein DprA [Gammaproteobacteria bacterium]|nr:DNA-processing protein DprA [Gammaproteobacteria bacterium]
MKLTDYLRLHHVTIHQPISWSQPHGDIHDIIGKKKVCIEADLQWLKQPDCHAITLFDDRYPALLKQIADPPLVLYVQGCVQALQSAQVAMVGSRKPTLQGQQDATAYAKGLARAGYTVTSGLAYGIDALSHQGALSANGQTIAVMGCGLQTIYPKANQQLARKIIEQGCLVSEYPPAFGVRPHYFPRRNRIISGLSCATLMVEARRKSGSLITAYRAVEQNRTCYTVPVHPSDLSRSGNVQLMASGAYLTFSVEDLLDQLHHDQLVQWVSQ